VRRNVSGVHAKLLLTHLDCTLLRLDSVGHPMQWVLGFNLESEGPINIDELRARIATRAREHDMYRMHLPQRIRRRPRFILAEDIDPFHHVKAESVEDRTELLSVVARLLATQMARDRPLWDVTLIDQRDSRTQTILLRVHHCLSDGVAAPGFAALFVDTSTNTTADYSRFISTVRYPFPLKITWQTWKAMPKDFRASRNARRRPRAQPFPPKNCQRQVKAFLIPVVQLRRNAAQAGTSTTEYILAAATIAYRRIYAPTRKAAEGLRVMIPITLDRELRHAGNAIVPAFLDVNPEIEHLGDQSRAVSQQVRQEEYISQAVEFMRACMDLQYLPYRLQHSFTNRFIRDRCDLTVSITPGFASRQSVFDRKVISTLPFAPLMADQLMVTALTLGDTVSIGIIADPRNLSVDISAFSSALETLLRDPIGTNTSPEGQSRSPLGRQSHVFDASINSRRSK